MVSQEEVGVAYAGVLPMIVLQRTKLGRVNIGVRVEAAQRGPVPARSYRQDRIDGRGRLLVLPQREQYQPAKLVQHQIVGQVGDGLLVLGQRPS